MKEIPLTRGMVTLVDDDDYLCASQHKWFALKSTRNYYAARSIRKPNGKNTLLLLHRLILSTDKQIDHINRNGLDNRRANLRPATASQNQANLVRTVKSRSGYKGVGTTKGRGWRARLWFQKKQLNLGTYKTSEDAARAYDAKLRELFGEYARCNFDL